MSMFDAFGRRNPGIFEEKPAGPDVTELQKQLAELQAANERLQADQRALLQQRAPVQQAPQDFTVPELNLDGLPDAFVDPAAYNKAFAERVAAHARASAQADLARERAAQQEQASQAGRVEQLWKGFETKHPDLAQHRDLIEFAAGKVVNDAVARNIDPDKYLFGTPDTFYEDVVKAAKAINPTLGVKQAEPEPDLGIFSGGPGMPEGRTGGVAGGNESGFKPSSGGQEEKPGDMIADLQKIQRASGYF